MNKQNSFLNKLDEIPRSYWLDSASLTEYPILEQDLEVDVAIAGGGLAGLSCAYYLKQAGLKVAVIEAERIAQGTTGHTTAKITSQHTLSYHKITSEMGKNRALQYAEANEAAIKEIARLVEENKFDCDFAWQSSYVFTQDENYVQKIKDEAAAASSLGIKASFTEKLDLPFNIKAALRFDGQAQFHPRKYLLALARLIDGDGSTIYEKSRVIDIEEGQPCILKTAKDRKITASYAVIATHYPFYDGMGLYFTRMYPERSYIIALKTKKPLADGMYISAEEPARSLRTQPYGEENLLLVAGDRHKPGQGRDTKKHYKNLLNFASQHFEVTDLLYHWSAQDFTTMDEVPYIGNLTSDKPNLFVATGFKKWGMTNGVAAGMILRDLIIKGESPWQEVYSPSRFYLAPSAKNFVVENLNVAKKFISGKLSPLPDEIELMPGEAKVAELDNQKIGVYKDYAGEVFTVDTTCTHLGCEVQWNSAEKSWDCPCHGSRFTYEGNIINGPALESLPSNTKKNNNKK